MRPGCEIRPQKTKTNRFSLKGMICVKRSDTVVESADQRRIKIAWRTAIDPPDRPMFLCRVISPEGDRTIRIAGKRKEIFVHVPRAAEDFVHDAGSCKLNPVVTISESLP